MAIKNIYYDNLPEEVIDFANDNSFKEYFFVIYCKEKNILVTIDSFLY